jgi:hypothetical protein
VCPIFLSIALAPQKSRKEELQMALPLPSFSSRWLFEKKNRIERRSLMLNDDDDDNNNKRGGFLLRLWWWWWW